MFNRVLKLLFCCFMLQNIFVESAVKHKYTLKHDKGYLESYNHSAGKDVTFSSKQIGDVQFGLSAKFCTLQEFGDGISVDAKIYKLQGTAYKVFPFTVKSNICKIWKTNMMGFTSLENFGNITGCGIAADTCYYINNFVAGPDYFPPRLPFGTYKLDIQFFKEADKTVLFIIKWFARVLPLNE